VGGHSRGPTCSERQSVQSESIMAGWRIIAPERRGYCNNSSIIVGAQQCCMEVNLKLMAPSLNPTSGRGRRRSILVARA
jgi:hypothetical protein